MKINIKSIAVALPVGLIIIFGFLIINKFATTNNRQSAVEKEIVSTQNNSYKSQTNVGGNVTVEVVPIDLAVGKPTKFSVSFNTHSVSLDFDVAKIALLTDSQGNIYTDTVWLGAPAGGHHRSGTLSFTKPLANKGKVILVLQNIAEISQREFSWKIQQTCLKKKN